MPEDKCKGNSNGHDASGNSSTPWEKDWGCHRPQGFSKIEQLPSLIPVFVWPLVGAIGFIFLAVTANRSGRPLLAALMAAGAWFCAGLTGLLGFLK
jgi:hypothetical protein